MKNFCRLNNFWLFSVIALFVGNSQLHIKLSLLYSFIAVVCCRWSVGLPPSMEEVVADSASMQRARTSTMRSPTVSGLDEDPLAGTLGYAPASRSWADRPRRHNFPENQLTKFHAVQTVKATSGYREAFSCTACTYVRAGSNSLYEWLLTIGCEGV